MIELGSSGSSDAPSRRVHRLLIGLLIIGGLVRLPGVAWGVNWPDGFTSHHPDEYTHVANTDAIVSPLLAHTQRPYPLALGALAATPFLAYYAVQGQFGGPRIHIPWTIGTGRLISVTLGVAAILIVFLIGRDALDRRAGLFAAGLLALGGLHVTQSHFFLSDVPAATCTVLAVWLLWRDVTAGDGADHEALRWAAAAAGGAFALKLFVFVVPALLYAVLSRGPRLRRAVHASVFFVAGFTVPSLGFETPVTVYRAATGGVNYEYQFDRILAAVLYAVQLPSFLTFPLLFLALGGAVALVGRLAKATPAVRRHALVIFGAPPVIALAFVLLKLDHFPRHWVVLIPWAAVAGGWALARLTERLPRRAGAALVSGIFAWMAVAVIDSERFFIFEPRNDALRWLRAHVPEGTTVNWMGRRTPQGYTSVRWFVEGDPEYLLIEMGEANHSLSGVNWRNSYPSDARHVFDGRSDARVAAIQALFRGGSSYVEVARFTDSYVMPEYRLALALVGDRARSYVTEVVVFRRRAPTEGTSARGSGE